MVTVWKALSVDVPLLVLACAKMTTKKIEIFQAVHVVELS